MVLKILPPEVVRISDLLQSELVRMRTAEKLDFFSATTGIPMDVLNHLCDYGTVHKSWLCYRFLSDALSPEDKRRLNEELKGP